jgi:hypothetical protein
VIFLIEYERNSGQLKSFRSFEDHERSEAERTRLRLELGRPEESIEIVLLEAESENALRRTHRRYFETAADLAEPSTGVR